MADTWGGSWGTSWAASWTPGGVTPPVTPPPPSGGPSGGAAYPHRIPHKWPGTSWRRKKLADEFEEAIEEAAERDPEVREAAAAILEPLTELKRFDTEALEARIEQAIIEATANDIKRLRSRLQMLEELLDEDDVETLLLH